MNTQQFLARMEQLYGENVNISRRKNADYAGDADPFNNFRVCEHLGITTVERALLVRMSDKMSRISNLIDKEAQVADESIKDTLSDLANYAMILRMWLEQKSELTNPDNIV